MDFEKRIDEQMKKVDEILESSGGLMRIAIERANEALEESHVRQTVISDGNKIRLTIRRTTDGEETREHRPIRIRVRRPDLHSRPLSPLRPPRPPRPPSVRSITIPKPWPLIPEHDPAVKILKAFVKTLIILCGLFALIIAVTGNGCISRLTRNQLRSRTPAAGVEQSQWKEADELPGAASSAANAGWSDGESFEVPGEGTW